MTKRTLYVPIAVDYFDDDAIMEACEESPWCEVLYLRLCCIAASERTGGVIRPQHLAQAFVPKAERWMAILARVGIVEATPDEAWVIPGWDQKIRGGRGWISPATRALVQARGTCHWCGSVPIRPEIDHVLAVSLGGSSDLSNLVLACRPCNRSKGAKRVEDWLSQ